MTAPLTQTLENRTDGGSEPPSGSERRCVLVVDDFDDAREMYAEYLEFVGFQVEVARNGVEAVEKAQGCCPDIILMDLSLPVMDGWEATRRLKNDVRTQSIPVVALTGHALDGHSREAQEAGCDSYVTKPCLPDALVREVQRVLATVTPKE